MIKKTLSLIIFSSMFLVACGSDDERQEIDVTSSGGTVTIINSDTGMVE